MILILLGTVDARNPFRGIYRGIQSFQDFLREMDFATIHSRCREKPRSQFRDDGSPGPKEKAARGLHRILKARALSGGRGSRKASSRPIQPWGEVGIPWFARGGWGAIPVGGWEPTERRRFLVMAFVGYNHGY